jgi:propanol-preferring alcohol dehydrogenase
LILKRFGCIIDTIPAWIPVVNGLKTLTPGGRLVINAIRKEEFDKDDLLKLDYPQHLWKEKEIKSVANIARRDVTKFLELAAGYLLFPKFSNFPRCRHCAARAQRTKDSRRQGVDDRMT